MASLLKVSLMGFGFAGATFHAPVIAHSGRTAAWCSRRSTTRRWDGDFLTVRELVARGELGRLTLFESHFNRFRPQIRQRWCEDVMRGGGLLFDLSPHLIDQALVLFDRPETVGAGVCGRRRTDFVHLVLGYANHEVILHASGAGHDRDAALHCSARAAATRSSVSTPRKTSSRRASRPTTSSSAAAICPACCTCSTASTPSSTARWRPRC